MEESLLDGYDKVRQHWNDVFSKEQSLSDPRKPHPLPQLEAALQFVCKGTRCLLDFGCGHGSLALRAAALGTPATHGIDFSEAAIHQARKRASAHGLAAKCTFSQGGISFLREFRDAHFDGIILANVLDSLYPQDGEALLDEVCRLLAPGGKILLKLNALRSPEQLTTQGYSQLDDEVFEASNGLLLWNIPEEKVRELARARLELFASSQVPLPQGGTNRLFLLVKPR